MATYYIENAKSGRAKCKKCKEAMPINEVRIAVCVEVDDKTMISYFHPECFSLPRKLGKITVNEFVTEHLEDKTTDQILGNATKCEEIIGAISKAGGKKKSTAADENPISKKIEEIKAASAIIHAEEQAEEKEIRPTKKVKVEESQLKAAAEAFLTYEKLTIPELKDVLRWNLGYGMTGTKDVLLLRCLDGHVNGRLPRCPSCFKGVLQLNDDDAGDTIKCLGYFDEDINRRIPCFYQCKSAAANRLHPWYFEQPTDEQSKEMKAITEKHVANAVGNKSALGSFEDLPTKLIEAANKLEWPDTSSIDGKKTAARLMVELCTSAECGITVDVPADEKKATIGVGKIIMGNPDAAKSVIDILKLVVQEYGISNIKEEAAMKQQDAIASSCACSENGPILKVLSELADLYFKEGNGNAGVSYQKAVKSIRDLNFEITVDNAKGLGKAGKNKIDGIGKGTADKIHEFLTTGKIEKLEEKRMTVS